MNKQSYWLLVLALSTASTQLLALDWSAELGVGLGHSNNSLKAAENEQSELERTINAAIQFNHSGESVTADVDYDVSSVTYEKETQRDETAVTGDASVVYEQIEQTLIWSLNNSRRSVVRDKSLGDIQDNREDRSITDAEARFIFRPSGVDSLTTALSYSDVSYEDTDGQDSDRASANLTWSRKLSRVDNLYVNTLYQDVEFDSGNDDYKYYSVGVGYNAVLSKLRYDVFVGYNEQDRESGGTVNGGSYRTDIDYGDGVSTWSLALLQQLTDTSRGNNNVSLSELSASANISGGIDSYTLTSAELKYDNNSLCSSCVVGVSFLAAEEDYEEAADDNEEVSIAAQLSYGFTPRNSIFGLIRYSDLNFKGSNTRVDYDVVQYQLAMNQQIARSFLLVLTLSYEDRSSDSILEEYDELSGGLTLRYTFR